MNEEPTKDLPNRNSFEERVFARFDSVDARLGTVDSRLEKLEARSFDTKPIWERALKAIMDMGLEMGQVKGKVGVIETKVEVLGNEIGVIKTDHRSIRNELVDMRRELKHHVSERLDLILKFLLEDREDIRDAEARIRELESKFV
jgi:chromosome segregation ATPase